MVEHNDSNIVSGDDGGPSYLSLLIAAAAVVLLAVSWLAGWILVVYASAVVVISIVIWQACDPFADAAQWIGNTFHVPGSVRGATLDAIASSLPELFTGIFFVVLVANTGEDDLSRGDASGEGYGATVATCAGSAVYNMILIPAFVALVVSFKRLNRPTVDVETKVIARDGVVFVLCEIMLIIFLFQNELHWWMAFVLIAMYLVYTLLLYTDWKRFEVIKKVFVDKGVDTDAKNIHSILLENGTKFGLPQVQQVQDELQRGGSIDSEDEDDDGGAGICFGFFEIPLNRLSSFLIIVVSTIVAAGACYFLVEVTRGLAVYLQVPMFFVAVIVAAAASSVPDTFISIGAAMRGDDSGAVSNAFGSNIFDICICLSVPLLILSYMNSWQPISLLQDGEPMAGLVGLRILLGVLTVVTLGIMWHNCQLTRKKAFVLCGLYLVFIAYAVLGSLGILSV
ncbi:hypothetical protein N9B54_03105 [Mariniblastus sp.]|nr:hypothetical protein [Mariniblastus sp.]